MLCQLLGIDLKTQVLETLKQLGEVNAHLSFHNTNQPLYKKLINCGQDAIPILLEHLRYDKSHAWWAIIALSELTGQNPIKNGHQGRLKLIIGDWLAWDDAGQPLLFFP